MRSEYLPQLSLNERERRWQLLREEMAERNLDALFVWGNNRSWGGGLANFRWITHVGVREGIALMPLEADPIVFAGNPHFYEPYNLFAAAQHWISDVRPLSGIRPVRDAIQELSLGGGRIGIVDMMGELSYHTIPYAPFSALLDMLPDAEFVDATRMVEELRMVKSAEEIGFLEEAGRLARLMVEAMINTARPGITEATVYSAMHHTLLVNGGEDYAFNLFDSGNLADPDLHLHHGKENPLSPTMRELREGDIIMTEFHSNFGGYMAACEKSVILGEAPSELKRIHEVCLQALESAIEALAAGNTFGDAIRAIRAPVAAEGLDFVELGLHGHGIGSPEFPTQVYKPSSTHTLAGSEAEEVVLAENMVFGTNIDIHDPRWRKDLGLMFGDTVVVTATGGRTLVGTPTALEKADW